MPAADPRPGPLFLPTLSAITVVGPLAVHLFFPAMPAVRQAFGVTDALAQFAASVTLFVMAIATLAYGSLSDRYGRRPLLFWGLGIFLAGTALAALAEEIEVLIAARLLQAIGAACGTTLARSMANDTYPPDKVVRAIAYLTMGYTIGPMIAPPIGGILVDHTGWRGIFVLALVIAGAVTVLAWFVLHETRPAGRAPLGFGALLGAYRRLFSSILFTAYAFQIGLAAAAFYVIAGGASFVMTDYLGRPASEYGAYFIILPIGFMLGNFAGGQLSRIVKGDTLVFAGSALLLGAGILFAIFVALGLRAPYILFLPGFLLTFAQGLSLPNAQASAFAIDRRLAGTASGIAVALQFILGGLFTQIFGLLHDATPVPLVVMVLIVGVLTFVAGSTPLLVARRRSS